MTVQNPKLINPICLDCHHQWSLHFVNDPEPRCLDRCGCERFRGGCANCNHPMSDHGRAYPPHGLCQNRNLHGDRCGCDEYEHSA